MDFSLQPFILGVVQGLCEFLPVSSSGHLALLQFFFDFGSGAEQLLAFDLLLHCATVLVVLLFFRRTLARLIGLWLCGWFSPRARRSEEWAWGWYILLGTAMTALVGFPLRGVVERMMNSPLAVGCGLLVTAGLLALVPLMTEHRGRLYAPDPYRRRNAALSPRALLVALLIGLIQGLAVLPGISRSGATIAAGLIMGLAVEEAFRFSFLLSVPAILGASLLEALKLARPGALELPEGWFWAVVAAFVTGWIALRLMRRLVLTGRWAYFGLYCLFLGSAAVLGTLTIF